MKTVKAILIDAENREIKEVDYDGKLETMYSLIDCRLVTFALDLGAGNTLYVDDEGYLNGKKSFFKFRTVPDMQWFAGNGLVVLEDSHGVMKNHTINIERMCEKIVFMHCDDEASCPKPAPMQVIVF